MRATIVILALLMPLSIPVRADPLPMPKWPSRVCPSGYVSDGSFCIPWQGAQEVVPKSYFGTLSLRMDFERQQFLLPLSD